MERLERYVDPQKVVADIWYLLACFNGSNLTYLRGVSGMKIAMEILGVRWWHYDAFGKRPHLLVAKWRDNLGTAGLQPDRREEVDWRKLEAAIGRAKDSIESHRRNKAKRKAQEAQNGVRVPVKEQWVPVTGARLNNRGGWNGQDEEELWRQRKLQEEGLTNAARWRSR
jgi:hypothetical protein